MSEKTTPVSLDDVRAELLKSGRPHPVLVMMDGRKTSRRFEINKSEYTLGRDETCDVVLHDTNCSRLHVRLLYANFDCPEEAPRVLLTDQQSTNGCYVNGKKVSSAELRTGDKLLIGKTLIGYFVWDDATLEAEDTLLRSASTDGLTGLYNRAFFDSALAREFTRAERYKRPASLILLELDRLKAISELHGGQAGDKVLHQVATALTTQVRVNDLLCRHGAEAFAIILTETPLPGAVAQAKRMCGLVREHAIPFHERTLKVTASLGVSEYEPWMMDVDHLVKAAASALFRAKRDGGDRVCANEGYSEDTAPTDRIPGGSAAAAGR